MRFQILSTLALLGFAAAEQTVLASQFGRNCLHDIDDAILDFDDSLSNWKGDYVGVAPLFQKSTDLVATIKDAANVPWKPADVNLQSDDENDHFEFIEQVITDAGKLVDTIIRIKVKVQGIPVLGVTLTRSVIGNLRDAASQLSGTYVQYASDSGKARAATMMKALDAHIERARVAYA